MNIDHTTTKCEEAETVLIMATVTGERSRILTFSFHVSSTAEQKKAIFGDYAVKCEDDEPVPAQTRVWREFATISVNLICSVSHTAGTQSWTQ